MLIGIERHAIPDALFYAPDMPQAPLSPSNSWNWFGCGGRIGDVSSFCSQAFGAPSKEFEFKWLTERVTKSELAGSIAAVVLTYWQVTCWQWGQGAPSVLFSRVSAFSAWLQPGEAVDKNLSRQQKRSDHPTPNKPSTRTHSTGPIDMSPGTAICFSSLASRGFRLALWQAYFGFRV